MGRDMSRYAHEYKRHERDFYPTPYQVVLPLLRHLKPNTKFIEPCAGDYRLVDHLHSHNHECLLAFDIEPQHERVKYGDAITSSYNALVITNPPWDRKVLHPMIENFIQYNGAWLVFDANWMHTKQAIPYMKHCQKIISVGRVAWIGNKPGKDDVCWYRFVQHHTPTEFVGRS